MLSLRSRLRSPWPAVSRAAFFSLLIALLAVLSGCSSVGDIFGGDPDPPPGSTSTDIAEVRGTVDYVDPQGRFLDLEDTAYRSKLQNSSNNQNSSNETFRLFFTEDTDVVYEGQVYRPVDLERGDQVTAAVREDDGRWYADSNIEVLYDSTPRGETSADRGDDEWGDDRWEDDEAEEAVFRGRVLDVDTRARTIDLERDEYGSRFDTGAPDDEIVTIYYDARTRVEYEGRFYEPTSLERGDEIRIEVERISSRWVAEEIEVVRSVRGS